MPRKRTDHPSLHVLDGLLTYRVTRLADTLMRAAAQVYRPRHGLTVTELRLLATIGHHQPLALNETSRLSGVDKAWVSRSLSALARRGLVARRPHPTDSRAAQLSLTRAGKAKVGQVVPLAAARNEQLLAGVGKAERAMLDRLLEQLQVMADRLLADPDAGSGGSRRAAAPARARRAETSSALRRRANPAPARGA